MRIAAIGRTEILLDTIILLRALGHEIVCIITSKEAPEYKAKADDFESLSVKLNCPFLKTSKINEAKSLLESIGKIDIAVSINYTGIIPQEIIDLCGIGVLNAHGGDLPRYRGNACFAWAIINGEDKVGLCIHKMIGGELDSGDIISRDYFPLNLDTKITEIFTWTNVRSVELFIESIQKLNENKDYYLEKQSTNPFDALRVYPRMPEDGLINWEKNATEIVRLINASNKPFAGAFTYIDGIKAIIWDAQILEDGEVFIAVPGQILSLKENYVDVSSGDNKKIRIYHLEIDYVKINPLLHFKTIRKRFK
jgi:methionyl-tRNA formyltransferase